MSNWIKALMLVAMFGFGMAGLTGCEKKEPSMGEKIEDAAKEAGEAAEEGAEKAEEAVKEAGEAAEEAVKEATE